MSVKVRLKRFFERLGYRVIRYDGHDHLYRRVMIMKHHDIKLVFDVGANTGQFGLHLRELGYKGRIISFEPLSGAFQDLQKLTDHDNLWIAQNYALGDKTEERAINIAGNIYSSSFLRMLPKHLSHAPESKYTGRQKVKIRKLDDVFSTFYSLGENVMLKLDTQGYEKKVISGSMNSIKNISLIYLETSLVSLYEGEALIEEIINILSGLEFRPCSIEPGFHDNITGQQLQANILFCRPM